MKRILSIFAIVAIAVAAMAFTTACSAEKKVKKDFGLELYSIRSVLKDAQGDAAKFGEIMKEVAGMGYTTVEPANYKEGKIYGLTPEEFRKALDEAGLRAISTHVSHYLTAEQLETGDLTEALEWWKQCIADFKAAGCAYIITPGMPKTPDEPTLALYCKYYNEVGKLCKAEGLKYGYHNHSYEFKHKLGDVVMYDYLVENTDPDLVFFQMDVYWAVYGNVSPVKYFQKYPGRFKSLHIKDYHELGESGMVGFDAIFKHIAEAGTEFIIVELEGSDNPSIMEGSRACADYLLNAPFVPAKY
ncbi:MAG: TIM barrel protein [Bacteroidales bacterium]|nr:TIM barrel protein [Bacteroidales bacterium]